MEKKRLSDLVLRKKSNNQSEGFSVNSYFKSQVVLIVS